MPHDTLSLTIGTGLGVSVLAGIISGVCFIVGYRNRISSKSNSKWNCNVCGKDLRSPKFALGNAKFVVCNKCTKRVCKTSCSSKSTNGAWICQTCCENKDSWVDGAFRAVEPFTKALRTRMSLRNDAFDDFDEDPETRSVKEKEQVRDFIERLVNNLLGDNVDDASINQIYDDPNYLPIIGDSPCSAHSALRLIVQKIIREARDLPKLTGEGTTNASEQNNRTYEDLLSTAILNKIISSSQSKHGSCSSRANSICSHRSSSSRRKMKDEFFLGEETLDNKWRNLETDTASISSLEEWVHSDSSIGSTKYVDRVSLTIKQRIDEVSSSDSDDEIEPEENEDAEYFRSGSAFTNDEPNWFLQRRQFIGGTSSPVPVPMLVPDPTVEVKVLIGDKDVNDTSDLSDVPSDFDDDNDRMMALSVENHLLGSKKLIGGKNPLADFSFDPASDDEISADSGVKECKDLDEVDSEVFPNSTRNGYKFAVDESISSEGSHTEKDTEYTERYATLPRTIEISKGGERLDHSEVYKNDKEQNENKPIKTNGLKYDTNEESLREFTGIYSSREKEKWKNAVELKNNPYSKENIEKRIKSRQSVNSLFGSDYYIRQACLPSGAKRTEDQKSQSLEEQEDSEIKEQGIDVEVIAKKENGYNLLTATPFFIDEPSDNTLQDSLDLDIHLSSEISDSDVSLVNCYDVTESVVYKKLSAENEEIQTAEKFFDFESLDATVTPDESDTQENVIPIAKPRKKLSLVQNIDDVKIETKKENMVKLRSNEIIDDNFDTIPYIINRRSDNTLIKKIYSDPSVRSFALSSRNKLPITENSTFAGSLQNSNKPSVKTKEQKQQTNIVTKSNKLEKPENVSSPTLSSKTESNTTENLSKEFEHEAFNEINELKQQKLVASILRQISKSSNNLSEVPAEKPKKEGNHIKNGGRSTSVRDLRKLFEQFDAKAKSEKPIQYSLTGRSISKQFKEKLRDRNSNTSPPLSQVYSLSLTNLDVEENTR